jgi:Protein of unknown function (DUF3108)
VTPDLKRFLLALATSSTILIALVLPAFAQRKNDTGPLPFSDAPYVVGERLTYNISFSNFISAGHVELLVGGHGSFYGRDAIQLQAHVETTGVVYAALFALNNDYTTYVDPTNGQPFRSQRVVREAARTTDVSSDYNQPAGTAAVPDKLRSAESPGTYDFLAALYRLRALPLAEGASYSFTVRNESQEYQAELRVRGREAVRTNVGSFNAIVSQIRISNNNEVNNYHLQIYFTDDERHVPVLITAKLKAGEVRVELASSQLGPATPPNTPPVGPTPTPTPTPRPSPIRPVATPTPTTDPLLGLPFKVGEQLNYQAFLPNVPQPVGLVTFQVRARSRYFDHDGLLFTLTAQTTNAAQRLFVANDTISSYVDPQTLLPYRTESQLAEGRRRSKETLTINQDYGTATTEQGRKIEMPVGTHDYISIFYAIRSMNLQPPKRNAVSILVNGRPKTLIITALKRERIQLGSEKLPAIQLSLTTDDAQPDKYALRAWVSDDDRRLPLRFTANTELGPLRVDLVILPLTRN